MNQSMISNTWRPFAVVLFATFLSGCASLMSSAASGLADNLSTAILNQDDPETVRAGAPSYLLLLDSFIEGSPDDPDLLAAGAELYAAYGAVFAEDEVRAGRLTSRARRYAQTAICESYDASCNWTNDTYDDLVASLNAMPKKHVDLLFTYGFATLAYLRTHAGDLNSLAYLPQAEMLLNRYLEISGSDADPAAHMYLGIILTLRPPALGGKPDEARAHFEKAIEMTNGRDLSAKVEFARGYAKMLYERELHDELLNEVLAADPYADGFTLTNVLAKQDAVELLAGADDYF